MECYRCEGWPCVCRDGITLIHGDNCDVMGQLPKESVDLVVTSPPKATGRKGIGIEVNEVYLPIAANRLRQEVLAFTD